MRLYPDLAPGSKGMTAHERGGGSSEVEGLYGEGEVP
jgi:hypothetical protein